MRVRFAAFICANLLAITGAWADDKDFLAARDAFKQGDLIALTDLRGKLQGDIFQVYADYYWLNKQLDTIDPIAVISFLQNYPDTWLAEKLRAEWLIVLAKRQDWANYQQFYAALQRPEPEHKCYSLIARIHMADKAALAQAKSDYWPVANNSSNVCEQLNSLLMQQSILTNDDYWLRLRLALQANNRSLARTLAGKLGLDLDNKLLDQIAQNPQKYLANPDVETALGHELYLAALARYARADLNKAISYWQTVEKRFNHEDRPYGWRILAVLAAKKQDERAVDWFKLSEHVYWPDEDKEWAIRIAIRAERWDEVLFFINRLTADKQQERAWKYWRARAMLGQPDKAKLVQAMLSGLAVDDDYYGLLARDQLGNKIHSQPKIYVPTEADKKVAQNHQGLQRALALFALDLRTEAVREWNWSLRNADDKLLLAAAEQAANVRWYDRAIYAAERTKQLHSYSLRYLTPYEEVVRGYTQELDVDPAWVYGLIRQESRFVVNAKSVVGAGGLMQLMPKTAQWVANRLNIPYHAGMVNEIGTNVRLGTYYISYVFKQLGNQPVLATAGYNAGPSRAKQWQATNRTLPVDVYTESIPFTETRDYVKKVMTNAVHYALGFGQGAQSITERMGTRIPARIVQSSELGEGAVQAEQATLVEE
ncbi:lytic transglycosylase domain-containing protein [Agitococcus lubricus]|uniref:Soluble lytic murein transglycosylase n=1 Tax=Agitococcus lubricus TaxID=1077255 RepID=A0A2T5J1U8_9GAMM|nr:lytic transglycosylase domain-containing protein [Agitococcus lubricus]PTQ90421.1 soluble lytic murein transglycosylase [Agitococcus lubricus]